MQIFSWGFHLKILLFYLLYNYSLLWIYFNLMCEVEEAEVHLFLYRYPIAQAISHLLKAVPSLQLCSAIFVVNQVSVYVWVCFWALPLVSKEFSVIMEISISVLLIWYPCVYWAFDMWQYDWGTKLLMLLSLNLDSPWLVVTILDSVAYYSIDLFVP